MLEILEWAQLLNVKKLVAAQNVSSLLLILYVISYRISGKGCLLTAFILCEFFANSQFSHHLDDSMYYLADMTFYAALYVYAFYNKLNVNTMLGCVIMILFDFGMALDAKIYPDDSTLIYEYYTPINLSIHLYLISTLFRWSHIRRSMENIFRAFAVFFRVNDSFSFFWYYVKKATL